MSGDSSSLWRAREAWEVTPVLVGCAKGQEDELGGPDDYRCLEHAFPSTSYRKKKRKTRTKLSSMVQAASGAQQCQRPGVSGSTQDRRT